LKTAISTHQCK